MYTKLPNLIIAFHGCDETTYENVLYKHQQLNSSNNDYDWLGNGIYFWEQNLERAWQWAKSEAARPGSNVKNPAVIGAVIDLGHCLNLLDSRNIDILKKQYDIYKMKMYLLGKKLPQNKNLGTNKDMLLRRLDCAVIQDLHQTRSNKNEKRFDSVRGVFFEGDAIYENSCFREKSHIQICIRNPNCIKGYFSPLDSTNDWEMP